MTQPSLDTIEPEIRQGLPGEATRWLEAMRQLAYWEDRGADLIRPRPDESPADFECRPKLTAGLTRRAIGELAKGLYQPGPTRELSAPAGPVTWYDQTLTANQADSIWQTADAFAHLHGVFAIGCLPTGSEAMPVRLDPWRADEFAVWLADDDPRTPWAVCVRSLFSARRQVRYQAWTSEEVRTYWTEPGDTDAIGKQGRVCRIDPELSGPHTMGVLPFVFVHDSPPVCEFWTAGKGKALADADRVLDITMSDLAQAITAFCIPPTFVENAASVSRSVHRPGSFVELLAANRDKDVRVFHAQPDLQIEEVWHHVRAYANHVLQKLDLPLTVDLEATSGVESGVAIVARRMPLLQLWQARAVHFEGYERRLKEVVLQVGGSYFGRPDLTAAATADLLVEFPPPRLPLPTPDRNDADEWELTQGLTSRVRLMMERHGLTRKQALGRLRQIAEDTAEEGAILTNSEEGD